MFCSRYTDDTLAIIKTEHLDLAHNTLNSFDKNLQFTIKTFDDVSIFFRYGNTSWSLRNILHAYTDQYTHYTMYVYIVTKTSKVKFIELELRILTGNELPQKKTEYTKIRNVDIWVVDTSNQLFIRGS